MNIKHLLILTVLVWFMTGLEIGFLKNYLFSEFGIEKIWLYLSSVISVLGSLFLTFYLYTVIDFEIKKQRYKHY